MIDARDLGQFVLRTVTDGRSGPVNAVGPTQTMADLIAACNPDAFVVYADHEWLLERDVSPFVELPLWLPPAIGVTLLASWSVHDRGACRDETARGHRCRHPDVGSRSRLAGDADRAHT